MWPGMKSKVYINVFISLKFYTRIWATLLFGILERSCLFLRIVGEVWLVSSVMRPVFFWAAVKEKFPFC